MRQYVLVAGVDFGFKGVNFRIFCDNRMKRIIAANKTMEELRFITIDVPTGEVITRSVTWSDGKKTESVTKEARYNAITMANYDKKGSGASIRFTFKNSQSNVMSVADVYNEVKKIGKSEPGTLHELSFFSHAYIGGPILVNSFDDGQFTASAPLTGAPVVVTVPSSMRDPDDKDPRHEKDFFPPVMSAADKALFRKAFHNNALVWIWGCVLPKPVNEILFKVEHHKDYKASGLSDGQKMTFTNFRADHVTMIGSVLGVTFADPKNVELTFAQIKLFFCLLSIASYSSFIADAANVHTFGGLVATYSEYDTTTLPLMHVAKDFTAHLTFYQSYLGFKLDPEGRLYGEYLPGMTCELP